MIVIRMIIPVNPFCAGGLISRWALGNGPYFVTFIVNDLCWFIRRVKEFHSLILSISGLAAEELSFPPGKLAGDGESYKVSGIGR